MYKVLSHEPLTLIEEEVEKNESPSYLQPHQEPTRTRAKPTRFNTNHDQMMRTQNINRPTYAYALATGSLTSYHSPATHAAEMSLRDRDNPNYGRNSNIVNLLLARQERLIEQLMNRQDRLMEERFKQHNSKITELVTQTLAALLPEIVTQIHQVLTNPANPSPK
jgi:carboxylesterase type B